jgi:hypothetical protein
MIELNKRDLYWVLQRAPKCVVKLMEAQRDRLFLAGGFVRACVSGEEPADVDLFAPDAERAALYAEILKGPHGTVWKSDNALTVRRPDARLPIQMIHRWTFERPEEVIESFDFTVAKAMVWCRGRRDEATHRMAWESLAHPDFYADLAAKRLVYTSPVRNEDAGGSALRVLKFYQKGYRIPLDSLGAVLARLTMAVDMERLSAGVDREASVAMALTGLLREVDPLQDPQHLFHLPSESDADAPA